MKADKSEFFFTFCLCNFTIQIFSIVSQTCDVNGFHVQISAEFVKPIKALSILNCCVRFDKYIKGLAVSLASPI